MKKLEIPSIVSNNLSSAAYVRSHVEIISETLTRLGVEQQLFQLFMERFEGPF